MYLPTTNLHRSAYTVNARDAGVMYHVVGDADNIRRYDATATVQCCAVREFP